MLWCRMCGDDLEIGEYDVCAQCADAEDQQAFEEFIADQLDEGFEDFMQNRFDMETEREYKLRKENCW